MPSIIISYRRADSSAIAGRIFDHLERHFGRDAVFMDIDSVPLGTDFREHIRNTLDRCDVMLAIVGPHWADGGRPRDRLADENDWVRIEVETALGRKIPVIPILIDGAQMPAPADLPTGLRDLAFRNAASMDSGMDFRVHMERLLRSLDAHFARATAQAAAAAAVASTPKPAPAPQATVPEPVTPKAAAAAVEPAPLKVERAALAEPAPAPQPTQAVSGPPPAAAHTFSSRLFSLDGRAGMQTWWITFGGSLLFIVLTTLLGGGLAGGAGASVGLIVSGLAGIYVLFAASVRRLHDRNKEWWWAIPFVILPVALVIVGFATEQATFHAVAFLLAAWTVFDLGATVGTSGDNQYGSPPK